MSAIDNSVPKDAVSHVSGVGTDSDSDRPDVFEGVFDPVYEAKAHAINAAIQRIGMGRYQWQLFVVTGFGWAVDNFWPIVTALILSPSSTEFGVARPQLLTLAQNIGLLAGALFWGVAADIVGRRLAFNSTLGVAAVFGLAAAGSPNFSALCVFAALWSFGVGGNYPVDSALFLEFLPGSHQYLLTILAAYWSVSQAITSLIAWPLLGNLSCATDAVKCAKRDNMGWRYFVIVMGGLTLLMFAVRFFAFRIFESPKYLMSRGRDAEAVHVVQELARINGRTTELTLESLTACELGSPVAETVDPTATTTKEFAGAVVRTRLRDVATHTRALFSTRRLALSTAMVTAIWAIIGLSYPLYNAFLPYIQTMKGAEFGDSSPSITYRNYVIEGAVGIPGCVIGGWLVDLPRVGRKGVLSVSTVITGVVLFGSTTALNSNALLGWNCGFTFTSAVMYAVLYAYTPEVFPTKDRGTGNALTASANRVFGIMAPLISMFANLKSASPVYVSGALFIFTGLFALFLPVEPRGKASL